MITNMPKNQVKSIQTLRDSEGYKIIKEILQKEEDTLRNSYGKIHSYEQMNREGIKMTVTADEQIQGKNARIKAFRDLVSTIDNIEKHSA